MYYRTNNQWLLENKNMEKTIIHFDPYQVNVAKSTNHQAQVCRNRNLVFNRAATAHYNLNEDYIFDIKLNDEVKTGFIVELQRNRAMNHSVFEIKNGRAYLDLSLFPEIDSKFGTEGFQIKAGIYTVSRFSDNQWLLEYVN